jgi:exopolyphosphatase/pppGpp-phosphohydrolase
MNFENSEEIQKCLGILRAYGVDTVHPAHVTKNAGVLFDCLKELHQLGEPERRLLIYGSLLHDIGWSISEKKHHRHSMDIILAEKSLNLNDRERTIVANIARYHRKALPSDEHENFSGLSPEEKNIILVNASILRIADALDRMHMSRIEVVGCTVNGDSVIIKCRTSGISVYEIAAVEKKSDLFEKIFNKSVRPVCLIEQKKK